MTRPVIVFTGDSITDCDRLTDPEGLGNGYVRVLAGAPELAGFDVRNRGISGNRVLDLQERWERDVVAEKPAILSVLVGVNETWRRYDSGDPTSAEQFEHDYRAILHRVPGARLVLLEPFLLPINDVQQSWRADLDEKRAVTRSLAAELGAVLIEADAGLRALGPASDVAPDGIHPGELGHQELARLWLDGAKAVLETVAQEHGASHGSGASH
jgi:lysophospholipase L1-like esterase